MQCIVFEVAAGVTCMVPQERLKAFCFVFYLNKYRHLSYWKSLFICLRGEIYNFVLLCFVLFVFFIFGDFCLLYLSDELWDHLSSCFQLLRRSQQTFGVDFNLSISVFVLEIIYRWIFNSVRVKGKRCKFCWRIGISRHEKLVSRRAI